MTLSVVFILVLLAAVAGIFKPYIGALKRRHFAIIAVVSFVLIGVLAPRQNTKETNAAAGGGAADAMASATARANGNAGAEAPRTTSKWEYLTDKDEMRGSETRVASLQSENQIDLDFPYGVVHGSIWIRRRAEDGLSTAFAVDKGQILCNSFTSTSISVKFDNKAVQQFRCTSASDGSTDTAFIQNESRFLSELKKSKRTVIEAEFFQKGRQQFTFDTNGLNWE